MGCFRAPQAAHPPASGYRCRKMSDIPSDPFDGHKFPNVTVATVDYGSVPLRAGAHQLAFTLVGKNSNSINYLVGIDYLLLEDELRVGSSIHRGLCLGRRQRRTLREVKVM